MALTGPARDDVTTTPGLPDEPEKGAGPGPCLACVPKVKGVHPQKRGPDHKAGTQPFPLFLTP